MDIIIKARQREYTEEQWRRTVRHNFSWPLPPGRSEDEEIAVIVDAQEVLPESAAEARRIAKQEVRMLKAGK